jgi:hypothetical protein
VAIGAYDDPGGAYRYWRLDQVLAALDRSDRFYVRGERSRVVAWVQKYVCEDCGRTFIRTNADATADNNLDNLPACR